MAYRDLSTVASSQAPHSPQHSGASQPSSHDSTVKILIGATLAVVFCCLVVGGGVFFWFSASVSRIAENSQSGNFENFDPNAVNSTPSFSVPGSKDREEFLEDPPTETNGSSDSDPPFHEMRNVTEEDARMAEMRQQYEDSMRPPHDRDQEKVLSRKKSSSVQASEPERGRSELLEDFADLIELVEPSVVRIDVTSKKGKGNGSGFAIDKKGTIVTNFHVIEGATKVTVRNRRSQTTSSTGYLMCDVKRDIAIIRVDPKQIALTPLPLAPTLPRKGTSVASFGSPLGFDFTAAEGVISSIRDTKGLRDTILGHADANDLPGQGVDMQWLQTTAAISPGNSGGPLVNFRGEMVGINSWTIPDAQNLNFAITVDELRSAIEQLSSSPERQVAKSFSSLPTDKASRSPRRGNVLPPEEIEEISGHDFVKTKIPGAVRQWHVSSAPISDIEVSEDGQLIALVAGNGSCYLLDGHSGKSEHRLFSEEAIITDVEFDRVGQLITFRTTSRLNTGSDVTIRNASSGKVIPYGGLQNLPGGTVSAFSSSPDGRRMFVAWNNGLTSMWKRATRGQEFGILVMLDYKVFRGTYVSAADFSAERSELVLGATNGWLSVLSTAGSKVRKSGEVEIVDGAVNEVRYSSDNKVVIACGDDGSVCFVRSLTTKKPRKRILIPAKGASVMSADYYSLRDRVGLVRSNGSVEIWDSKNRKRVDRFPAYSRSGTRARFTAEGKFLIVGFTDGYIAMYPTK